MILDLDHKGSLDPGRVGSKAARLALGRRAGLPVLPGLVVEAIDSVHHMQVGARALTPRGSGGARLAVSAEPYPFADELQARGSALAPRLVVRSSTLLESSGEWSGAFTSYLDVTPEELPKAVVGCWASAFSVASLERQSEASISPGAFPMAVLVQPALDPTAGGTAELADDGTVTVHGVKGSPAPLLQGWSSGETTRQIAGSWAGQGLIDLLGTGALDRIATTIREAMPATGANHCEWALDQELWLLQLEVRHRPPIETLSLPAGEMAAAELTRLAGIVARASGPLGEDLLLPWALGGLPKPVPIEGALPPDARSVAAIECRRLTAEVWDLPEDRAMASAAECIGRLLGPGPGHALDRIRRLRAPDPQRSGWLMGLVAAMEREDHAVRRGVGRWEPFLASVALALGEHRQGTAAAPGIGAGVVSRVETGVDSHGPRHRAVIVADRPLPVLASLLWDAAGLVTATGSPAAHLFDSARALGVPAVCGVDLGGEDQIVAIDGHSGVVATIPVDGE